MPLRPLQALCETYEVGSVKSEVILNHPCVLVPQQPQSLFSAWNDVAGWGFGVGIV